MTASTQLETGSVSHSLVKGDVDYCVLLPPGYDGPSGEALPLLLHMHGGGLNCNFINEPEVRGVYEQLWREGALPPMIVACYSARGSVHFNYRDGSERWEDFAFLFIDHMAKSYPARADGGGVYLFGISMGALGSIRLSFKYPDKFAAVAAMEGVYNPAFDISDVRPRNFALNLNRPAAEQEQIWGHPPDPEFYRANNQANLARDNADQIRKSRLKIYIESGDRDCLNAHDGAEFLHRILWEQGIEHEYRLLHHCDHMGASLRWRIEDAHRWIGRMVALQALGRNESPYPQPTAEQQSYLTRAFRGEVDAPPNEKETLSLFDDAAITAHRTAMPDNIARYADKPLDGVFRNGEKNR